MAVIRMPDGSTFVGLVEEEDKAAPAVASEPAAEKPKRTRKPKE